MTTFIMTLIALAAASLQQSEPAVSKDAISIHTVQRGNMRLRLILQGAITSVQPATATVSGPLAAADHLKTGQAVEFEFQGRRAGGSLPMLAGTVTRLQGGNGSDSIRAEIGFSDSVLKARPLEPGLVRWWTREKNLKILSFSTGLPTRNRTPNRSFFSSSPAGSMPSEFPSGTADNPALKWKSSVGWHRATRSSSRTCQPGRAIQESD